MAEAKTKKKVIDIDAAAGGFAPVEIRFRGKNYFLGRTVLGILEISDQYKDGPGEGESEASFAVRMVRPSITALCPELSAVIEKDDLTAGEEIAMLRPLTEVVQRFGAITF